MIWGAMIALATVADKKPDELYAKLGDITTAIDKGTLITQIWGIKALAKVAAANITYKKKIFPLLTAQLKNCLARDVPIYAESILPAIDAQKKPEFLKLIEARKSSMTPSQLARLNKVLKQLG